MTEFVERERWNELYGRAVDKVSRPPAEIDSVPLPESWGTLPDSEVAAQAFLADSLSSARRWLDLGCGTGSVAAALLKRHRHASAVGIDVSDMAVRLGRVQLARRPSLRSRLTLRQGDLRHVSKVVDGPFDLVLALFSLQFLRPGEFFELMADLGRNLLGAGGRFAATVRSASRSVPASYEPVPGEPHSYRSHEPHEEGMVYHHYSEEEILAAASILRGRLLHLREVRAHRCYDAAGNRAWWSFVIETPGA